LGDFDEKHLWTYFSCVLQDNKYKCDMTRVIRSPCENMDKKYILRQLLFYALCCYTGVMDFQYAYNEAKHTFNK
jgi:hypothetical protein